jgi:RHS repeat-associated protein
MTSITYPSTATNTFSYNGLDARVGKVDSGGTSTYSRDGTGVTAPVMSDGTANYTPGVSERRSSTSSFVNADRLGSMTHLTDGTQATTDTRQYDAFGLLTSSSGATATPFAFVARSGYQTDSDSGLLLLGHRYYDPSTGRFTSRDPAKDGVNWYMYVRNSPQSSTDPAGLQTPVKQGSREWRELIQAIGGVISNGRLDEGNILNRMLREGHIQVADKDDNSEYGHSDPPSGGRDGYITLQRQAIPFKSGKDQPGSSLALDYQKTQWLLEGVLVHELDHQKQFPPIPGLYNRWPGLWELGPWRVQKKYYEDLWGSGGPTGNQLLKQLIKEADDTIKAYGG